MAAATYDRYHLVTGDDDLPWHLVREGEDEPVAMFPDRRTALLRGLAMAEADDTALVIHAETGRIRSVIDPDDLDDLEVLRSGPDWIARKAGSKATVGVWADRNEALQRALEIGRARGARVTLIREERANLVWRNATPHVRQAS